MALSGVTAAPEAVTVPERSASSSCCAVVMTIPPPASWNDARGDAAGGFAPPNQFDQNAMWCFRKLFGSQHQDAAGLIDRAAGIDVTGQRPAERVADGDNAVDALSGAFLVRLDVASRIMAHGNVGGVPSQHGMAAMPERA